MSNYTLPTNETGESFISLFTYINNVSNGWFFLAILFALFVIVFISLKNFSNSKAFTGASFLNMILAIIFRVLGFIENKWMYLSIILVAVAAIWLHIDNSAD